MAEDPWAEGRQAWSRLSEWIQFDDEAGRPHLPDSALTALGDVGLVRRLVDRAEFEAVRSARRQGRSWSEIAIRLGVTRQSAWERWHDLDDDAASAASAGSAGSGGSGGPGGPDGPGRSGGQEGAGGSGGTAGSVRSGGSGGSAGEVRRDAVGDASAELSGQVRERRRRSVSVVPDVVGLSWTDARQALRRHALIGENVDPNGPPLVTDRWPGGTVVDQSPGAGAKVPPGSTVKLWLERGDGGSGEREPRRPKPNPRPGTKQRDEITGEAV